MQFPDKVSMPVLWRLVMMARLRRKPVETPQVPFLDKLFMPVVVSGADGQTVQITVEFPQMLKPDVAESPGVGLPASRHLYISLQTAA